MRRLGLKESKQWSRPQHKTPNLFHYVTLLPDFASSVKWGQYLSGRVMETVCVCVCVCVCVRAQPGPTLCNPRLLCTCSHPGSSVPGIFQARILEQVAISSSRGSSQPRDQTHISCISCTGRSILYHLKTGIVPTIEPVSVKFPLPFKHLKIAICIFSNFTVSWIPWNQS